MPQSLSQLAHHIGYETYIKIIYKKLYHRVPEDGGQAGDKVRSMNENLVPAYPPYETTNET